MLLSSHPNITCLLEVFDALPLGEADESDEYEFPVFQSGEWLYRRCLHTGTEAVHDPTSSQVKERLQQIFRLPYSACGFKFKTPVQLDVYPEIMDALVQRRDSMRVICLTRRNVLKQAISKQNMERLNAIADSERLGFANCNLTRESKLPPFELDIDQALKYACEIKDYQKELTKPLTKFSQVKTVDYEDLLQTPTETYQQLLEFLGVDGVGSPKSYFVKSTPDDLRMAISNYDQLARRVANSEFAKMLC